MPKKPTKKATRSKKRVRFWMSAPEANEVFLAGNFNGWTPNRHPMKKDEKGNWQTAVDLPPGTYEYRFLVDGVWYDDPNVEERVDNPYGTQNSIRTVG